MRLQKAVARDAAHEQGGRKYIKFDKIILLLTQWCNSGL